ncbi:MAG TPA: hypothetical protein ENN41_04130 [Sediminispirochaeta sp.]|nr:hypothetical protein [Sediminispirochaeta sp.]
MEFNNFPAGRKVFYLFPEGLFHQAVVKHIINQEYEIYTLSDYRRGLPLIFQYNGAIVFLNLSGAPDTDKLLPSIRDFCRQGSTRSIALYFLCDADTSCPEARRLSESLDNCSFLTYSSTPDEVSAQIEEILENLEARGQRNFVRFGSNSNEIANISFKRKEKAFAGRLHDISAGGLSFSLTSGESLPLRAKLSQVTVDLGYLVEGLSGTVSLRRRLPDDTILYVLLFDKGIAVETQELLRFVIHASLQRQFITRLKQVAVPD